MISYEDRIKEGCVDNEVLEFFRSMDNNLDFLSFLIMSMEKNPAKLITLKMHKRNMERLIDDCFKIVRELNETD